MVIFDRNPGKLKKGTIITWMPVDNFADVDETTNAVLMQFVRPRKKLEQYLDEHADNPSKLMGTHLRIKTGMLKVYCIFVKQNNTTNPFAALNGIREIFDEIDTLHEKVYICQMNDTETWSNLKRPLERIEGTNKLQMWYWAH